MEQENIPIFSERGALDNTMKLIWKLTRWLNELFKIKKESFTAPKTILNSLAAHTHTWPMYFDYSSDTVISDDIKIDRCAEEREWGAIKKMYFLSLFCFSVVCCCRRHHHHIQQGRKCEAQWIECCASRRYFCYDDEMIYQQFKLMMRGGKNPFKHCKNTKQQRSDIHD